MLVERGQPKRTIKKMKSSLVLLLCLVVALICGAFAVQGASYTLPTFKSQLVNFNPFRNNETTTLNYYCDARKKIIRIDATYPESNTVQKNVEIYEINRYTVISYNIGDDQSIECRHHDKR